MKSVVFIQFHTTKLRFVFIPGTLGILDHLFVKVLRTRDSEITFSFQESS